MRLLLVSVAAVLAGMLAAAGVGFLSLLLLWLDFVIPLGAFQSLHPAILLKFGAIGVGILAAVLVFRWLAFADD